MFSTTVHIHWLNYSPCVLKVEEEEDAHTGVRIWLAESQVNQVAEEISIQKKSGKTNLHLQILYSFLLQVYKTGQTSLWKWILFTEQNCWRWSGAGQACCAGFEDQERDVDRHAEDWTEADWLAGCRTEDNTHKHLTSHQRKHTQTRDSAFILLCIFMSSWRGNVFGLLVWLWQIMQTDHRLSPVRQLEAALSSTVTAGAIVCLYTDQCHSQGLEKWSCDSSVEQTSPRFIGLNFLWVVFHFWFGFKKKRQNFFIQAELKD